MGKKQKKQSQPEQKETYYKNNEQITVDIKDTYVYTAIGIILSVILSAIVGMIYLSYKVGTTEKSITSNITALQKTTIEQNLTLKEQRSTLKELTDKLHEIDKRIEGDSREIINRLKSLENNSNTTPK